MQALTVARQRIRARIESASSPRPVRLAHRLVENGQSRLLPVLSSPLAQEILTRGYDARILDRVYSNHPEGGMVGRMADRTVLEMPVHQGLRERLQATVGEICSAAALRHRAGETEFRVLTAPCGFAAELQGAAQRLRVEHPEAFQSLRCWGVDADRDGHMLPEANRRLRAEGLNARLIREDLRRQHEVRAVARREGPFHLVCCTDLPHGRSKSEIASLVRFYAQQMASGGTLLIDRWESSDKCVVTAGLAAEMPKYAVHEFNAMLAEAGLKVEREHPTGEGGCVLVVARKVA